MTTLAGSTVIRRRLRVTGVVQGVGFRPHVYRLASEIGLCGWVSNDSGGLIMEVEGPAEEVSRFERCLVGEPPPLARVDAVEATFLRPAGLAAFRIVESSPGEGAPTFVSPDVAVCDACLREMRDPADRRFGYPLINCTNCGPRFTITIRLPYDRPNTSMAGFTMCPACSREYHDPADRRFHAQPVGCPRCGPDVAYEPGQGTGELAVSAARAALRQGRIVAVKGVGGYHLACNASDEAAVSELRRRKRRPAKPLAVMVRDIATARRLGQVSRDAARLLQSVQRPIVLVPRRPASQTEPSVAPSVAPDNPYIGLLLPYTPLHHLLFDWADGPRVLVMTSGNLSEEPICYEDRDARDRLGRIADGWLTHNRPIHVPCDDSVILAGDRPIPVRRSRGYAPLPITLPFEVPPLLAVGGELKNTFCLAAGRRAWMSQHLGDASSAATLAAFERSVAQFTRFYSVRPEVVAADLHPGYLTRAWAERHPAGRLELVQHHHAHIASVMAEHALGPGERVIGFAFDGTGYGSDGAIWGAEVLVAGYREFERAAHLRYVTLPPGDRAARAPYLAALAHLRAAGIYWAPDLPPVAAASREDLGVAAAQSEGRLPGVRTSSMGRLFDAIGAVLGLCPRATYEAQAAIELQARAAGNLSRAPAYRFAIDGEEIDPAPVLGAVVADVRAGRPPGEIAAGFHLAVAALIADLAGILGCRHGVRRVALSGGVFQNELLARLAEEKLAQGGFEVLTHQMVPPNDGGLALGQAAVAGAAA